MRKFEIICDSCDKHFIVVDIEESPPNFCPYCSDPINIDSIEQEEE